MLQSVCAGAPLQTGTTSKKPLTMSPDLDFHVIPEFLEFY